MIELPESKTLAQQMLETLKGKTVMNVSANKSPHKFAWFSENPDDYHQALSGKGVTGSDSYGGMAELQMEDMKLIIFDGVNMRYFQAEETLPDKHQLHIEFEDFSSVTCGVQMYGGMSLIRDNEYEGYNYSSKFKIKPLDKAFDEFYFEKLLSEVKPTISVKAFLATEQRIPGLGNGVLQDILFNARLHPKRKLSTLTDGETQNMFKSVKQTLFEMTARGGRDTEKDLFGCPGGYQTKLSAKTKDDPCPVCQGSVVREAYMGGNIYFCPTCQRL